MQPLLISPVEVYEDDVDDAKVEGEGAPEGEKGIVQLFVKVAEKSPKGDEYSSIESASDTHSQRRKFTRKCKEQVHFSLLS